MPKTHRLQIDVYLPIKISEIVFYVWENNDFVSLFCSFFGSTADLLGAVFRLDTLNQVDLASFEFELG